MDGIHAALLPPPECRTGPGSDLSAHGGPRRWHQPWTGRMAAPVRASRSRTSAGSPPGTSATRPMRRPWPRSSTTTTASPFAGHWGEGTTSSSDGQRYRTGGLGDARGQGQRRVRPDPGVTFYTHVSDRYAPFHTKLISTTVRDATQCSRAALPRVGAPDRGALHGHRGVHRSRVRALPPAGLSLRASHPDVGDTRLFSVEKPGDIPRSRS